MNVLDETFEVVVQENGETVGTKHYETFPTDEQIMDCITDFDGDRALVQKVYTLGFIPFTEDDNVRS